jgi:hypothetical protein
VQKPHDAQRVHSQPDPLVDPAPAHTRWGAWYTFLRGLRLCGGPPAARPGPAGEHGQPEGGAADSAAAPPATATRACPPQRQQGARCSAGACTAGRQAAAPDAAAPQLRAGHAGAPVVASGGGVAPAADALAASTAAAAAVVGHTSEWEAFLAQQTHEWEFNAKPPEDEAERRAAPRRRRHGGEHGRPGARQRDTSFYASMVHTCSAAPTCFTMFTHSPDCLCSCLPQLPPSAICTVTGLADARPRTAPQQRTDRACMQGQALLDEEACGGTSSRQRSSERRSAGGTTVLRLSGSKGSLTGRRLSSARTSADCRDVVLRRRRALAAAEATVEAAAGALEVQAAQAAAERGPDNDFGNEMLFQRARLFHSEGAQDA